MSVRQLLASMDSRELQEWQVFLAEDARRAEDARERAALQRQLDQP